MKFIKTLVSLLAFCAIVLLNSCGSDPTPVLQAGATGYFVVNEGSFGGGNATISFYDRKTNAMTNNVFGIKNTRPLGDQAQSMTIFEGRGFIVVQNSSKIEVMNIDTYASIFTISAGLPSPRYFIGISTTKGYVSDWGADGVTGTIKVIDLNSLKVIKTIPTGKGANRMLKVNNLVYVTNVGGYDKDNTVKVIDTTTDAIVASITTGDNPNSIQLDKAGDIWVASSGNLAYNPDFSINIANSTKGTISKINSSNVETLRLTVDQVTYSGPANLSISPDGATLYYSYNGAIYSMSNTAASLPAVPFKAKDYYSISVDPFNGDVIGCNAPSFSAAGSIDIFDSNGTLKKNYTVGIAPNGCAFK